MIQTKYGLMTGVDHGDYIEYRKVPYAKPPVGELRFRRPVKPDAWEGIYRADTYACKCVQEGNNAEPWGKDFYSDPSFRREMSEDCLYLNIWAPREHHPETPYPVAYWIHGGAFMGGFATEMEFDGAEYARRGVILVSVEYRCNLFGFFAHPWLTAEDEDGICGNYGIYDQIAGIDWVIENIAAFGGDPANITVFGQSAGAMSTQTLISSKLTRGKIAKAILQSGGSYGSGLHMDVPMAVQEKQGQRLTEMLGVNNLEELRAIPTGELMEKSGAWIGAIMQETKGLFLVPNQDGKLLDDGYYAIMDKNEILEIPYLIGWTKDDLGVQAPDRALVENGPETMLKAGSIAFSQKLEELGRSAAYVYAFNRNLPGDNWGAYHSSELFYTFGTLGRTWRPFTEGDYALSAQMLDYWTNFMKNGNPNGNGSAGEVLPDWQPCTRENPFIRVLDV